MPIVTGDGSGPLRIPVRVIAGALGAFLLVGGAGCGAGWHRPDSELPAELPPRQQVEVWHGGKAFQWHAVRLTADSISGVPFIRPVDCDSCRLRLARAGVDSVRLGNPMAGFWKTTGLVMAILVTPAIIYCWKGCPND